MYLLPMICSLLDTNSSSEPAMPSMLSANLRSLMILPSFDSSIMTTVKCAVRFPLFLPGKG